MGLRLREYFVVGRGDGRSAWIGGGGGGGGGCGAGVGLCVGAVGAVLADCVVGENAPGKGKKTRSGERNHVE